MVIQQDFSDFQAKNSIIPNNEVISMAKALIIVNLQNDFCEEGALPVPDGEGVVPIINELIPQFDFVIYTRDWHPQNHVSFSDSPQFKEGSWPVHCIANTRGADFHPDLEFTLNAIVIDKGIDITVDSLSGFSGTNLGECLHKFKVETVYITGLPTDYSVKATALDAIKEGFTVYLVLDACRGLDQPAGSLSQALEEMKRAGVKTISATEV
jgi:nicotinamidase/pyrazinamidase